MTTLEVLKAARAKVKFGWCQHRYFGPNGECCLRGALLNATENCDLDVYQPALDLVARGVGLLSDVGLAEWNDAPGRTQAEVLAAFDKAIAIAEQYP